MNSYVVDSRITCIGQKIRNVVHIEFLKIDRVMINR